MLVNMLIRRYNNEVANQGTFAHRLWTISVPCSISFVLGLDLYYRGNIQKHKYRNILLL